MLFKQFPCRTNRTKFFAKNSNLNDSGISLPVFPSRTNLKLHNISIIPKMVKKVITKLDSSKASGPDCIPVVVLKKLWAWTFIHTSWTLQYVSERVLFSRLTTAKNYRPVSFLSVVGKVFEKLVNNRIVDHLEICGLFSNFQYGFRYSRSTADLLTVVSDRMATAFNRSGATRPVALGTLVFFTNLRLVEFLVRYLTLFLLFSVIRGSKGFCMGNLHYNIQLMLECLKGPFFLLHLLSIILLSILMILLCTLNVI